MVRLRDTSLLSSLPVAGRIKDGDPSERIATVAYNFHSDSAKRLVMMYSIMDL
jgi:aminoglycoside phosphotransferase family enzyme